MISSEWKSHMITGEYLFKRDSVGWGYALTVSHRPSRFHAVLSEIRLAKRIEIGKTVLCRKG